DTGKSPTQLARGVENADRNMRKGKAIREAARSEKSVPIQELPGEDLLRLPQTYAELGGDDPVHDLTLTPEPDVVIVLVAADIERVEQGSRQPAGDLGHRAEGLFSPQCAFICGRTIRLVRLLDRRAKFGRPLAHVRR